MLIYVETGEFVLVDSAVRRLKPNAKGNRPKAVVVKLPTSEDDLVLLRFSDGNTRASTPGLYGLKWVPDDDTR